MHDKNNKLDVYTVQEIKPQTAETSSKLDNAKAQQNLIFS